MVRKQLKFTCELVKVSVCRWRRLTNLFPFLRRCVVNSLNKSKSVCVQHWFPMESNKTIKGLLYQRSLTDQSGSKINWKKYDSKLATRFFISRARVWEDNIVADSV